MISHRPIRRYILGKCASKADIFNVGNNFVVNRQVDYRGFLALVLCGNISVPVSGGDFVILMKI